MWELESGVLVLRPRLTTELDISAFYFIFLLSGANHTCYSCVHKLTHCLNKYLLSTAYYVLSVVLRSEDVMASKIDRLLCSYNQWRRGKSKQTRYFWIVITAS